LKQTGLLEVNKDTYRKFIKALSPLSVPFLNQLEVNGMSEARILIIDDDENIRKVLQAILEDEGYAVDTAETAKKGIERSEKTFYNLALIDVRLPDMEGIELLSKLRGTKPKMRKIIVTGYPTLQNAVSAVNKGADAYVMKPFEVEKILQTIQEQLTKQEEEKSFSEEKVVEFIETRIKALETTGQTAVAKKK
jgi:DNA-binding NtrC family response regulator